MNARRFHFDMTSCVVIKVVTNTFYVLLAKFWTIYLGRDGKMQCYIIRAV